MYKNADHLLIAVPVNSSISETVAFVCIFICHQDITETGQKERISKRIAVSGCSKHKCFFPQEVVGEVGALGSIGKGGLVFEDGGYDHIGKLVGGVAVSVLEAADEVGHRVNDCIIIVAKAPELT